MRFPVSVNLCPVDLYAPRSPGARLPVTRAGPPSGGPVRSLGTSESAAGVVTVKLICGPRNILKVGFETMAEASVLIDCVFHVVVRNRNH